MNLTFRQLRLFLALADTGSVSAAARVMHVTQPTASMQLKEISQAVGLPLYEVIGKKVHLTDVGHELAATASVAAIAGDSPEADSAKPPFRPSAINRYKDRNFAIAGGISRFERSRPATRPKTKKRIAGSSRFCMGSSRMACILLAALHQVKSIIRHMYIGFNL